MCGFKIISEARKCFFQARRHENSHQSFPLIDCHSEAIFRKLSFLIQCGCHEKTVSALFRNKNMNIEENLAIIIERHET
jgi:hypothetical protein